MLGIHGGNSENGAYYSVAHAPSPNLHWSKADADDSPCPITGDDTTREAPKERGRTTLAPSLQIPKNKSTGNLGPINDSPEKARIRFSFDAGAAAADYDAMTRLAWPA